ncbi:MAG: hypothetical protein IPL65_08230 [Lewinellaceae bacterium]|nr:hypothetical protein [Lewinellaceae bacterium]
MAITSDAVRAGVEFGTMTREGNCVNVGICRMTSEEFSWKAEKESRRQCRKADAQISVRSDGGISILFPKLGMLPCTARAIFKPGYFPVPETYVLPAALRTHLPQHAVTQIDAGKYRVLETPGAFIVHF